MTTIVGAGLAGLLASNAFPMADILEQSEEPAASHRALLRFRSDAVSRLTGIPFRPVRVRKGIWFEHGFVEPTIQTANLYCRKVLGDEIDGERSIWSVEECTRYIAPESFYDQLIAKAEKRIQWGTAVDFRHHGGEIINTAPLSAPLSQLGLEHPELVRAPIIVRRYRLPVRNVFQTIYYPTSHHGMYRASITNDLLICEFSRYDIEDHRWKSALERSFAIDFDWAHEIDCVNQKYGKIAPLQNDEWRRATLARLTMYNQIYSLGRFATWRNILLDDVVKDIDVIKRLMTASQYELRLAGASK